MLRIKAYRRGASSLVYKPFGTKHAGMGDRTVVYLLEKKARAGVYLRRGTTRARATVVPMP